MTAITATAAFVSFAIGLLLGIRLGWKGHIHHLDVMGVGKNIFKDCTFSHTDNGTEFEKYP